MEEANNLIYSLIFQNIKLNKDFSIEILPSEETNEILVEKYIFVFDLIQSKLREAFYFVIHKISEKKSLFTSFIRQLEEEKLFLNKFMSYLSMIQDINEYLNTVNRNCKVKIDQEMHILELEINKSNLTNFIKFKEDLLEEIKTNECKYNQALNKMNINYIEKIYSNLSSSSDPIIISTMEPLVCTLNNNLVVNQEIVDNKIWKFEDFFNEIKKFNFQMLNQAVANKALQDISKVCKIFHKDENNHKEYSQKYDFIIPFISWTYYINLNAINNIKLRQIELKESGNNSKAFENFYSIKKFLKNSSILLNDLENNLDKFEKNIDIKNYFQILEDRKSVV